MQNFTAPPAPSASTVRHDARPADVAKVALIRSIAGHAEGREADALIDIAAVLNGVTLEELAAVRAGVAR